MDEPRTGAVPPGWAPPPALCGFLLLLALALGVSYAVGVHAGPVAPGMQAPSTGGDRKGGGGADMGDMRNMEHGDGG
ncbi:hypothetical protein ACH4TX_32600 [Streptomyces sp. NPDC021098]|uniref:hypothetical protein n=1 Tax=unclassified Streptomyces TaxID=2593676 RepID=UPI003799A708